jgi:hypothetical protein
MELDFVSYGIEEACRIWGYNYEDMFPEVKRDRNINRIIGEE